MSKRTPTIEWLIAEDDKDWERLSALFAPDNPPTPTLSVVQQAAQRFTNSAIVLVFLVVLGSGWWWRTVQAELRQDVAAVETTGQPEWGTVLLEIDPLASRPSAGALFQQTRDVLAIQATLQTALASAERNATVRQVAVQDDQALVRLNVMVKEGAPAQRQTRFYQRTATGWQPTVPTATQWGAERRMETPSFRFHFRQNDTAAVVAVATPLERLYSTLQRDLGLATSAEKLVIEVSVTQTPGNATWPYPAAHLVVASPVRYAAPVELTDEQLLAQSLALPLLDHLLAQASEQHATDLAWQPVLNGVGLWQLWNADLPLAGWQEAVVRWIYGNTPANATQKPLTLPADYQALCAMHKLWMPYPVQIHIPLTCTNTQREVAYFTAWYALGPPLRLQEFALPINADPYAEAANRPHQPTYAGRTIALATVVEYAVTTYGRDSLPKLVTALGQYNTWETLLPAVFATSAAEFEAGWQGYMRDRYGAGSPVLPAH